MITPTSGASGAGGMDMFQLIMMILQQMMQQSPQQAGNFMQGLAKGTPLENDPTMLSIIDKLFAGQELSASDKQFLNQNADILGGNLPTGGRP
ncbi:hypothetical protein [Noviherbaspirillum sp.]|uniref:hypothetical protein n=1 Tax=Noviherbaspirillum sp. TaxID=1926288 RepID=UPI002FE194F8